MRITFGRAPSGGPRHDTHTRDCPSSERESVAVSYADRETGSMVVLFASKDSGVRTRRSYRIHTSDTRSLPPPQPRLGRHTHNHSGTLSLGRGLRTRLTSRFSESRDASFLGLGSRQHSRFERQHRKTHNRIESPCAHRYRPSRICCGRYQVRRGGQS